MSYSIIRVQKMNGQAIKGIQIHNQREKKSETNPDIREADQHLNYDLINGTKKLDYRKEIDKVISENVKSEKKIRKDAVLVSEFLITSDTDFFDKLSPEEQKRYFETAKDFIADRYGQQNVIYATVHNDEKTPHMHVGIVPVTEDGRLSAKEVIGNRMQLVKLQDAFNAHVKTHGFDLERGLSRSGRKHLDMPKFKQKTAFEAEKEATAKYEQTISKIKDIGEKTKAVEDIPDPTRMMGRVMVKSEDYDTLLHYAANGAVAEVEVMDLQRKLTEKQETIVQLKTEMKEGQEELRKNYFGIEYQSGEIRANLEELANERAQEIFQKGDLVAKHNNLVEKYNRLLEKARAVHYESERLKTENKTLIQDNAGLKDKNESLEEKNGALQKQIQSMQQEFAALKERAVLAFQRQFGRVKDLLRGMKVEPGKMETIERFEEKIVSASVREIEKPKQPQKTMEMER